MAPLDAVDEQPRALGITDGGQLRAVTPQKLASVLGVDGLLYGEIEDYKYRKIGTYANRLADVRLTLVDPQTGRALWEAERRSADKETRPSLQSSGGVVTQYLFGPHFPGPAEEVARRLAEELGKAKKAW
jgi:hypothetical protein